MSKAEEQEGRLSGMGSHGEVQERLTLMPANGDQRNGPMEDNRGRNLACFPEKP